MGGKGRSGSALRMPKLGDYRDSFLDSSRFELSDGGDGGGDAGGGTDVRCVDSVETAVGLLIS